MERETAWWLGSFLLAVLLTLAAGHFAYFPGDVAITSWCNTWFSPPSIGLRGSPGQPPFPGAFCWWL